jgi:hypothetical protein
MFVVWMAGPRQAGQGGGRWIDGSITTQINRTVDGLGLGCSRLDAGEGGDVEIPAVGVGEGGGAGHGGAGLEGLRVEAREGVPI